MAQPPGGHGAHPEIRKENDPPMSRTKSPNDQGLGTGGHRIMWEARNN